MGLDDDGVGILDRATCLELLRSATVGRVGITVDGLPAVLPVNFALFDGDIVIRTGSGSKLSAALAEAVAAFEVDRIDSAGFGWSVLIRGRAVEVRDAETLLRIRELPLRAWAGGRKDRVIRIMNEQMTGRSIVAA